VTLNLATNREQIQEALKAASLEDICAELERKAKLCLDMADDCCRFFRHEDDSVRADGLLVAAVQFRDKADTYRVMAEIGRGK